MKNLSKNYLFFPIIFLVFSLIFGIPKQGLSQVLPPKPSSLKLVNDFAKIYSEQESNLLEEKLIAYNNRTSTQIAIVTITSLDGYPIDDYAIKLANQWQIGQKGKDNGLLILIAKEDHKIYIASGYGMEGVLNDGKLGTIIRTEIIPQFKNGNYYAGTNDGLDAIISAAAGEYVNDKNYDDKKKDGLFFGKVMFYVILFLVLMFYIRVFFGFPAAISNDGIYYGNRKNVGFGGGGGGFGGGRFGGGGAGGSW